MESSNEKFTRIAEYRVNKVLDGYRLLANLKGANYKSTQEQRNRLIIALRNGLDALEMIFAGEKIDKVKFTFKSDYENSLDEEPIIQ